MKKAFTLVASSSFYQYAVRLFHNLKKFHPDIDVFLLFCEEPKEKINKLKKIDGLNIVTLDQVEPNYKKLIKQCTHLASPGRIMICDYLIKQGYEKLVYLDCDIDIYQPVDELFKILDTSDFLVSPHVTDPVPIVGDVPHLWNMRGMGTFNAALFGCTNRPQSIDFITWWKNFTYRYNSMSGGCFAEQGWLDFSICFMDKCHVLRHPGYNVMWENICERDLKKINGVWTAKGELLHLYHFSGYKKHKDTLFTPDNRRYIFPGSPLEELYKEYEEENNKYLEYKI